jgi:hypothetical protein
MARRYTVTGSVNRCARVGGKALVEIIERGTDNLYTLVAWGGNGRVVYNFLAGKEGYFTIDYTDGADVDAIENEEDYDGVITNVNYADTED